MAGKSKKSSDSAAAARTLAARRPSDSIGQKRAALGPSREIAISKFKAKCLSLLEEVSKTKTPLRVTRRGKAIADVVPASPEIEERSWIGSMSGSMEIIGDIVSPVIDLQDIEALRE